MERYPFQPLIGISGGLVRTNAWSPALVGHRQSYVEAVLQVGGLPVLLPPLTDPRALRALYERLDGVLLAGGDDIDPARYGEAPHPRLGAVSPERDTAELLLARWAFADGKPLLGICRGLQVLNVARGGTLWQDIPSQISGNLQHNLSYEREDWTHMAHEMRLAGDSRLRSMLGVDSMTINSLHHQSVRDLAPGLRAVAWAPDGVIEAVEGTGGSFVVGVQCHPEALQGSADQRWQAVFAAFVQSCVAYRSSPALAA